MTVKVFADTNLFVYAEAQDSIKAMKPLAIIEKSTVISTQVINETR